MSGENILDGLPLMRELHPLAPEGDPLNQHNSNLVTHQGYTVSK